MTNTDPPESVDAAVTAEATGTGTGTALTIADAARAAGTDRHAIRRKLHAGAYPNAFKDEQGFWRIYASDLRAAEVPLTGDSVDSEAVAAVTPGPEPTPAPVVAPRPAPDETELLRLEVIELRHRVAKAEALLEAERRLSQELSRALQVTRRTGDALIAQVSGQLPEPRERPASSAPAGPRVNWQAGLRAARAREAEIRAAREREANQKAQQNEAGS